jgi:hypothetical protein
VALAGQHLLVAVWLFTWRNFHAILFACLAWRGGTALYAARFAVCYLPRRAALLLSSPFAPRILSTPKFF